MSKEKFFEENDHKFSPLFEKDYEDLEFPYFKYLVSDQKVIDLTKEGKSVPTLLYGTSGVNSGFCVYTGSNFMWISADTPEEAVKFTENIVSFENSMV